MLTVDDFVKLLLAVSFAVSLLGISMQLMKLISRVADVVLESKQGVTNFVEITNMATEDYTEARSIIKSIFETWYSFKNDFLQPITSIFKFMGKFGPSAKEDAVDSE